MDRIVFFVDTFMQHGHQFKWSSLEVKIVFEGQRTTLSSSVSLLYGLDELLAVVCFKRIIFWVDPYNLYGSFTIGVDAVGCSGFNSHFFEKMICRHLVCMTLGIPPFLNTLEWVPVRSTVNQLSARLDPLGPLRSE